MSDSPYPGLRPFKTDESYLFFGREEQTDQLIDKLADNHFIAVLGLSGCGKSSLVRAGLIADLESGYMADADYGWQILTMRPGNHPMQSLAQAILTHADYAPPVTSEGEKILNTPEELAQAIVARGPLGLAEILQERLLKDQYHVLFLVDQFEELFQDEERKSWDEQGAFVVQMLNSSMQEDIPIYVVITMRSEKIGECARFHDLPEAIDRGHFLTPRLTREQVRKAIVDPAQVSDGSIAPRLLERLLNDLGQDQDQLPVLQHCLMRMWGQKPETPCILTLDDYNAVGGLSDALSNHADEVFNALSSEQQRIAEILFRRITERGIDGHEKRHPVPLAEIAAVASVSMKEIMTVADPFLKPDCSFLILGANDELDICHESLIRQWKRLDGWVTQETESAAIYQDLEKDVRQWRKPKLDDLWQGFKLDEALKWKKREQPTDKWAKRYGEEQGQYFNRAIEFLNFSRCKKLGMIGLKVGILLLLVVIFTASVLREKAFQKVIVAQRQTEEAKKQAETNLVAAEDAKKQAEANLIKFQDFVRSTIIFIAETGQTQPFAEKMQRTPAAAARLNEILSIMLDSSKSLTKELRESWKDGLSDMNIEQKADLLDTLGTDLAQGEQQE